jgi:hypothetical protein
VVAHAIVASVLSIGIVATMPSARKEFRDVYLQGTDGSFHSILLYVGNVLFFSALTDAPNPGLREPSLSLEVVVTSIVGYFIVSDSHDFETGSRYGRYFVGTFAVVPTK